MNFFAFLNKRSHTILELFIIFAVVVVLVGVGLPMYKGMQDSGRLSQAQAELKTMQAAVTSYYLNAGHTYPNSSTSLGASTLTTVSPQLIRTGHILYDPFVAGNSTEYGYQLSSNGKYYVLYSKGPSGNGSVSIDPAGVVTITDNAVCVTNGSGCSVGAINTAGAGTATDSCGGCTGGMRCCNGTCVDVSSNVSCCGSSLTACSLGQICTDGTCCASGQTGCNGTCSTLSSDPNNCGSCGNVCAGGCIDGVCAAVPGAPTGVTATAGNASASVTFSAPASNGGSPITSYTVTSSPGGFTSSGSSTTQTVTGLTNGTSYTFTVTATNAVGTGPASSPSNAVTPSACVANGSGCSSDSQCCTDICTNAAVCSSVCSVPSAPTLLTATPGQGQITGTFTPPVLDGGCPITQCSINASVSSLGYGTGTSVSCSSGTFVLSGLIVAPYTVTVSAMNSAGFSASSNAMIETPLCISGGSTCYGDGACCTNICANNRVCGSTYSVPGAPSIYSVTAGNGQVIVFLGTSGNDGGYPITSYTATSNPGSFTATAPATVLVAPLGWYEAFVTVTGLTNGTPYTFTGTATSVAGTSAVSGASNAVTPCTVPGAPTGVTATAVNTTATVTFSAPASNGGSAITSYTVTSSPGGFTSSGSSTTQTVTGLINGTSYTFTVTATNSAGTGPASSASNAVTPICLSFANSCSGDIQCCSNICTNAAVCSNTCTIPNAPTGVTATAGVVQATVTFTPPAIDGGCAISSYTVTSNPGSLTSTGPSTTQTVTGLTIGTSYTFTVTATNSAGTSAASSASNAVIPTPDPCTGTASAPTSYGQACVGALTGALYAGTFSPNGTTYHYLVTPGGCQNESCSSPSGNDPVMVWATGTYASNSTGATNSNDGKANTTILAALSQTGGNTTPAAVWCANMTFGGYTDWFLPSINELNTLLYTNLYLNNYGGFTTYWFWWSSTEYQYEVSAAWDEYFSSTGGQMGGGKTNGGTLVRCVRRY